MARRRSFGDISYGLVIGGAGRARLLIIVGAGADRADDLASPRAGRCKFPPTGFSLALVRAAVRSRAVARRSTAPPATRWGRGLVDRCRRRARHAGRARPGAQPRTRSARVADSCLHVAAGPARPRLRPGGAGVLHAAGLPALAQPDDRGPHGRDHALHPAHHDGQPVAARSGAARILAEPRRLVALHASAA